MSEIINGTYSHGEHRPIAKMSKSLGMKANKKQHSQLITENTAQVYLTIFPSEHPKIYAYVNCAICINILRFFDLLHCLRTSSLYLIVCFCSFLLVYFLLFLKKLSCHYFLLVNEQSCWLSLFSVLRKAVPSIPQHQPHSFCALQIFPESSASKHQSGFETSWLFYCSYPLNLMCALQVD